MKLFKLIEDKELHPENMPLALVTFTGLKSSSE